MTDQQRLFRIILDKHSAMNRADYITSNEFHAIWNAMTEYINTQQPTDEKIQDKVDKFKMDAVQYNDSEIVMLGDGFDLGAGWFKKKIEELTTIK